MYWTGRYTQQAKVVFTGFSPGDHAIHLAVSPTVRWQVWRPFFSHRSQSPGPTTSHWNDQNVSTPLTVIVHSHTYLPLYNTTCKAWVRVFLFLWISPVGSTDARFWAADVADRKSGWGAASGRNLCGRIILVHGCEALSGRRALLTVPSVLDVSNRVGIWKLCVSFECLDWGGPREIPIVIRPLGVGHVSHPLGETPLGSIARVSLVKVSGISVFKYTAWGCQVGKALVLIVYTPTLKSTIRHWQVGRHEEIRISRMHRCGLYVVCVPLVCTEEWGCSTRIIRGLTVKT